MSDRLVDGGTFPVLTVVDQRSQECPLLEAVGSLSGRQVRESLERWAWCRGLPESITVDNGPGFCSRLVDAWAYQRGVKVEFIRPGKPTENGYIRSFNGKQRDERLNVDVFFSVADARQKPETWRGDYREYRPHSAPGGKTPLAFLESSGRNDSANP